MIVPATMVPVPEKRVAVTVPDTDMELRPEIEPPVMATDEAVRESVRDDTFAVEPAPSQ
jgi:hypothetical protein